MNALTFWDLLACAPPERVALWAPEPLRYAALRERSEDLAGALVAAGVRAGDRVGVHLPPSVDEVAALFAVARLGAVMVPLPAQLPLAQVLSPLQDCGAVATLCAGPRAAELPGAIDVAGPLSPGVLPPPPRTRRPWRRCCTPPAPPGPRRGSCTPTGRSCAAPGASRSTSA